MRLPVDGGADENDKVAVKISGGGLERRPGCGLAGIVLSTRCRRRRGRRWLSSIGWVLPVGDTANR
jgi:hypothetical protein